MLPFLFLLKVALSIVFYITIAVFLFFTLRFIARHYKKTGNTKLHRTARILLVIVFLPVILPPMIWLYASLIEPNWIEVKKIAIESPYFNQGLQDLKIIQISDLHIEKVGFREKRLVNTINNLKPDIILINGDFINSKAGWRPCFKVLKQLKAKKGIYTILGDTDYIFVKEKEIIPILQHLGITVLLHSNSKIDLEGKGNLWLAGLSSKYGLLAQYGRSEYIEEVFDGIPPDESKILIIENPDYSKIEGIKNYNPQLILAGDTHGGQVGISFLRQFSDYANRSEYMAGLFNVNGIPLYVNRGIGMKSLDIRFLCRPEITLITLKHRE